MVLSTLVSLDVALSGIVFWICPDLGSVIARDKVQFPYTICDVAVCNSILRAFSPLWNSQQQADRKCGRSCEATRHVLI